MVFPFGMLLHNLMSALIDYEEPFFFILGVILAPAVFIGGLVGAGISTLRGRRDTAPKG